MEILGKDSVLIEVNVEFNFKCINLKGESKKGAGSETTINYANPKEFCDFNNHIVWNSPVFEVFKMGCNIFAGQGTEFIKPDMVQC